MTAAIHLEGVSKRYRVYRERYRSVKEVIIHRRFGEWDDYWALRDVDLTVEPGSSLGIIGANGAGKSTSMKVMARILMPDGGRVTTNGKVSSLIELGAGFQAEYTGRENVFLNASLLGLTGRDIRARFDRIVEFAELEEHIDKPIRTYSSGMVMRLAFAIAIHVDPEILLVDEVLAVGDESFQRKCFAWFQRFQREGGTLVLVSHSLGAITQMCDRAIWLAGGTVCAEGGSVGVVRQYLDAVAEQGSDSGGQGAQADPPVRIVSARLVGGDGKIAHTLSAGEPLTLKLTYRVVRPGPAPTLNVMITREDGLEVYSVNSDPGFLSLPTGSQREVGVTFPTVPLLAGAYMVTASVLASDRADAVVLDSTQLRFNMVATGRDGGLIRLAHSWSADPETATLEGGGGPGRAVR